MNPTKTFKRVYTIVLLLLVALAVLAFHPMTATWPQLSGLSAINLQQVVLLMCLGGLPGVLVWSSRGVKSLAKEVNSEQRMARYTRIVYTRLGVFFILGMLMLVVQAFTHLKGILMMFMVLMVLFLFIWPTRGRFDTEMSHPSEVVDAFDLTDSQDETRVDESDAEDNWLPK